MASLFESLAVTGSRKADGTANASGRCWFYQPGTQTTATIYGDAAQTAPLSNPVTLSAGGKATVYFAGQVDVFIEDSARLPISTLTLSERAERVEVRNAGFTGLLPSGSQGAGGATDLNTVLSSIFASVGGLDGQYKEFTGATSRSIADKFRETWVSVKDYLARGDGIRDDTTSIQTAINEVARLGGGIVYFPPGTYLISAVLTSSANGVTFAGAGAAVSIIKNTNTLASAIAFSSCSGIRVLEMSVSHSSSSTTGVGISFSAVAGVSMQRVTISGHLTGVSLTGATTSTSISECNIQGINDATSRAISYNTTGIVRYNAVEKCYLYGGTGGAGNPAIEYNGAVSDATVIATYFVSSFSAIRINSACTGQRFAVVACPSIRSFTLPFDILTAVDPQFQQSENGVEGTTQNITSGSTFTPNWTTGRAIRLKATTTSVAYTIAVPVLAPVTQGVRMSFMLVNDVGAPITGWTFAGGYHRSATVISLVDGHRTMITFEYDVTLSVWREVSCTDQT